MKNLFEKQVIQDVYNEVTALTDSKVLNILHQVFDVDSPISGKTVGSDWEKFMAEKRVVLSGNLYDAYMNGFPNAEFCECGSLLDICPDAYEHMTHGV
jgi:hypothetical protein